MMNSSSKGSCKRTKRCESKVGMEALPTGLLIQDILLRLDFNTLCSLSCVSKPLRFAASQAISLLTSLDLSVRPFSLYLHLFCRYVLMYFVVIYCVIVILQAFSPDAHLLTLIFPRFTNLKTITLDCLRLDDTYVTNVLGSHVEELKLLKCSSLSSRVLAAIGTCCPNLRLLVLELADTGQPNMFNRNLAHLLRGCSHLEVWVNLVLAIMIFFLFSICCI